MTTLEMGTNPIQQETNHVIGIWEVNEDRLASMHKKISEPPRLLSNAAGKPSCCIFRIPQSLLEINGKSYNPQILSIGPYHRGEPRLKMIEEHKWHYLGSLLTRTEAKGLTLNDYFKALEPLQAEARECYSESINLSTDEFIEMMVLDGCFIIELFRKFGRLVKFEEHDPLVSMVWIISFLVRDLLRLENQIPYFVLEVLFDLTTLPEYKDNGKTLSSLALEFFNNNMQRPDHVIQKHQNLTGMVSNFE